MLTLFEWAEQRARHSDPVPSQVAAAEVGKALTELQQQFIAGLRELGQATSNEVAAHVAQEFARRNTLRRRASDLVDKQIRAVGTRKCRITGRPATVYELMG
jgi:hypothetical protein